RVLLERERDVRVPPAVDRADHVLVLREHRGEIGREDGQLPFQELLLSQPSGCLRKELRLRWARDEIDEGLSGTLCLWARVRVDAETCTEEELRHRLARAAAAGVDALREGELRVRGVDQTLARRAGRDHQGLSLRKPRVRRSRRRTGGAGLEAAGF